MKTNNWQSWVGGLMLLGFPVWMLYWVNWPVIIYIYALMLYSSLAVFLFANGMSR